MNDTRIFDRCPACGRSSLIISDGGHLVCGYLECTDPTAVGRLLSGRLRVEWAVGISGYLVPGLESRSSAVEEARKIFADDVAVYERRVGEWANARDEEAILNEARPVTCAGCDETLRPDEVERRYEDRPFCHGCVVDAFNSYQAAQESSRA